MSEPNADDLHLLTARYFDGELEPENEPTALAHLSGCAQCQAELGDLIGLEVALGRAGASQVTTPAASQDRAPPPSITPIERARAKTKRTWLVAAAGAAALAAAALAVLSLRPAASPRAPQQLALAPTRAAEPRFSAAQFRGHRPYSVARGHGEREQFSLDTLAALERQRDTAALAAALAQAGELDSARRRLQDSPPSASTDADLAAVELLAGRPELALEAADRALAREPGLSVAWWNRALALRNLELPLTAAAAFEAAAQQREEGWAAEAAEKAQQLRAAMALRSASAQAITEAGRAMVDRTGPPLTATDCERQPGLTRVYFHDALRSAATGDEALALLPLARCLDLAAGHGLAERELRRVASLDFRARGPLASAYRDLVLRRAADGGAALLRRLEGGPRWAHDLRLGALVVAGQVASSLEEVRALITDTADPWFTLMLPAYDAERQLAAGASDRAEHTLRVALAGCDERRWAYRCAHLADRLQKLYGEQGRYADHELQVEAAVRLFRAAGHSQAEDNALAALAKARHLRGRMALAAATFQEARSRLADKYCSGARFATAGLAELSVYQRATLDDLQISPDACGDAPSAIELATVVDLARMSGDDDDRATAKTWIAAARAVGDPGLDLLAEAAAARLDADRDPSAALGLRALLPKLEGDDETSLGFHAWVMQTLIDEAAKREDFAAALRLMAEELGMPPPTACAVAVSLDDRSGTAISVAADGAVQGTRTQVDTPPRWSTTQLVAPALQLAVQGCPRIDVIARPPLHGRADLLPPTLPWGFVGRPHVVAAAAAAASREVFIGDALPPAALALPALSPMQAPADAATLRGGLATPAGVLAALTGATYAELHVHGQADLAAADASFLALSPGADQRWALTAGEVRKAKLTARPVIVLAACRAARVAPYEHRRWSLPDAFLEAGARAVIAPTVEIPDDQAVTFFSELRQRLARGEAPATALAAVRTAYVERGAAWAGNVILFE